MQSTRKARLESVIREELSEAVSRDIRDPRIPPLSITKVDLSPDGANATVFTSIFSLEKSKADVANCLKGLRSASGFLRRRLARNLRTRSIPNLVFKEDRGMENSIRVHELLNEIHTSDDENHQDLSGNVTEPPRIQ